MAMTPPTGQMEPLTKAELQQLDELGGKFAAGSILHRGGRAVDYNAGVEDSIAALTVAAAGDGKI